MAGWMRGDTHQEELSDFKISDINSIIYLSDAELY